MPSIDSPGFATLGTLDDIPIVMDVIFPTSTPAFVTTQIDNNVIPYYSGTSVGDERLAIDVSVNDTPSFITTADPIDSSDLHIDVGALPSGGSLDLSVWFIHPDGTRDPLPHFTSLTVSPIANDVGSVSIEYPVYGLNFNLLQDIQRSDRDYEIAIWLFGRDTNSLRVLLTDAAGDEVKEDSVWTFTGTFLEGRTKEAITFPNAADPTGKFETLFTTATAGTVMRTLMAQAAARGALTDITYTSFSDVRDSNGVLWANQASLHFGPGTTYFAILQAMVGYGMCEWEINASHELRLYNAGAKGADLTLLSPPVVLYKGRNITDGPRKYSNRDAATTLLAAGQNSIYYDQTDATALARRGRRIEKLAAAGNNLTDITALTAYVQAELPAIVAGTMELSHGLVFGAGYPLPAFGFNVGDWVWSDSTGVKERLRILQWTLTTGVQGTTGTITLNDFLRDYLSKLSLKLSAIEDGVVVAGTSTLDPTADTVAPAAPTGLNATSLAYYDAGHNGYASILLTWNEVLLNTDGTACNDLAGYHIQWRYVTLNQGVSEWFGVSPVGNSTTTTSWGQISPGEDVEIRVLAVDNDGHESPWSSTIVITTETDAIPPPVPSAPTVSNFLGVVTIMWDGLGSQGEAMPFDFDHVEVHISTAQSFAPDSSTFFGNLFANGGLVYTTTSYDVEIFALLISVDQVGNQSAPSPTAGATPNQVLSQDIFDGAVGTSKLQELVVKNANIDLLAVNDGNIGNLSVGKLTAGIMTATVVLAGVIRTDWTGARTEIDNAGIRLYDPSGTATVNFNSVDGSALITGTLMTAYTSSRIVINPAGSNPSRMDFYGTTGSQFSSIEATSVGGEGAITMTGNNATGVLGGCVLVRPGFAHLLYGAKDFSTVYTEVYADTGTARMNAIIVDLVIRTDRSAPGGNRVSFTVFDSTGVKITPTQLNYWSTGVGGGEPWLAAVNKNSGMTFATDMVYIVANDYTLGCDLTAKVFHNSSSRETKTDIRDARAVVDPLSAIDNAPARAWRRLEGGTWSPPADEDNQVPAPITSKNLDQIYPIAEDLPDILVNNFDRGDGNIEKLVSLNSVVGLLWEAVRLQRLAEIRTVSATVVQGAVAGNPQVWDVGTTRELAVVWEAPAPKVPSGVIISINPSLSLIGQTTAVVKPGSITTTGCTIVATARARVVLTALLPIIYSVTGLYDWIPPFDPNAPV